MKDFNKHKLYTKKTLGERLKMYRKRNHHSLANAEEETRVRLKYLEALEKGDYGRLPEDVYTIGFLSKYADFLGAPKDDLIELYKKERGEVSPKIISPRLEYKEKRVFLTTRSLLFIIIILVALGIFGYIFYSVRKFTSAPNMEISSPVAESVIREDKIEVVGKTDPGATLQINDQVVLIDPNGNFHEQVNLQSGLNNIEIKATNRLKKETIRIIKILAEY